MLSNLEGVFLSILDDRAETKWAMGLLQSPSGSDQRLDPVVTRSDTSETGGGMMYASRWTWSDRKQADALLGGEPQLGVTDTTVLRAESADGC